MDILDFLPEYPEQDSDDFYSDLYKKKEFYENRLDKIETFPKERGLQTKYQITIARYLSSHTPYDKILLIHSPGLGKSCSAIGAIEQIIREEKDIYQGAIILAKGNALLDNFKNEIVFKCTDGKYIPKDYDKLTSLEKKARIKKLISFYKDSTYIKFARSISSLPDSEVISRFSNLIIIVDEIHNIKPQDEEEKETYAQFHRFFHLIKNCKVLFLSGTPMKDSPEEIATVMNLLLPLDKQLPIGKVFMDKYIEVDKSGIKKVKENRIAELKDMFKGKISFLRQPESTIPRNFLGKEKYGGLKHLIVDPLIMSDFQSQHYIRAYAEDISEKKTGVFTKSKEATLFVYPNGTCGREGFSKYIKEKEEKKSVSTFVMTSELKKILQGEDEKSTLEKIRNYSCIYAAVIEKILNSRGNCFVYSSIAKGSGAILFALLLELFNFRPAQGKETTKALRYALLTKKTATDLMIRNVRDGFNRVENMKGEYIKVIIGTRAISEGYSFNNVIFESINTPHFNYSETAQAIARGIRLGSHNDLLNVGENPVVEIMQPVGIPRLDDNKNIESIDLKRYKLSEDKDVGIASFLRILMESSIDCGLNYRHNVVSGMNNSRECDYMECEFKCDGLDMSKVHDGLNPNQLDYLTYNLYYANQPSSRIKIIIENYLRKVGHTTIINLKKYLLESFTEKHIENVLKLLDKEDEDIIDLQNFRDFYSKSSIRNIIYKLEELVFKTTFILNYSMIVSLFTSLNYNVFEIISSLREIINNNIVIKNRYGFNCYLREDNNMYYLVNTLSGKPDYLLSYYTENLFSKPDIPFDDVFNEIVKTGYSDKIKKLSEIVNDTKKFSEKIKLLDKGVQLIYLQASIISMNNNLKENTDLRNAILDYFKTDYQKINGMYVITNNNPPLCLYGNKLSDWKECDQKMMQDIKENKSGEAKKFEETKYGVYGKYNQKDDKFWIIDLEKEKESRESKAEKRGEKAKVDKRMKFGKNCESWKLNLLLPILVKRLKINAPGDFLVDFDNKKLVNEIQKHKKNFLKNLLDDKSNRDELKRILYWGKFSVKNLCNHLKKWFVENNLLQYE